MHISFNMHDSLFHFRHSCIPFDMKLSIGPDNASLQIINTNTFAKWVLNNNDNINSDTVICR